MLSAGEVIPDNRAVPCYSTEEKQASLHHESFREWIYFKNKHGEKKKMDVADGYGL